MEAKKQLACDLVARFHSPESATHERQQFEQVFSKNKVPDDMPVFSWDALSGDTGDHAKHVDLMAATNLFESKGAIRRLIQQGAVKIDGEKQGDPNLSLQRPENEQIHQAGKRIFFKILP